MSAQEKAAFLQRQRDLEKDAMALQLAERQARELCVWKTQKEIELAELHEQVEAGQAFESMVEGWCVYVCLYVCVYIFARRKLKSLSLFLTYIH